jgi:hypothetical protein
MRVQAKTEFDYAEVRRNPGDVFEMDDRHAEALTLLDKVMKAEDNDKAQNTAAPGAAINRNRYNRRDMRAKE